MMFPTSPLSNAAPLMSERFSQTIDPTKLIPKPKRALSSYNIYFKWVRELVLKGEADQKRQATEEELLRIRHEHQKALKRSHKKTHGKVSFQALNLIIAKKWKESSAVEKTIFERHAALEKEEYSEKFERWQLQQSATNNVSHFVIPSLTQLQQQQRHQLQQQQERQRSPSHDHLREDDLEPEPYIPSDASSSIGQHGGYECGSGEGNPSEEQKMNALHDEGPCNSLLDNLFLSHHLSQYNDDLSTVDMEPRPIREERRSSLRPLEISNLQWQAYPWNDLYEPVRDCMESVFDD